MNKTTKLFAIALLLVASTGLVKAMDSDVTTIEPTGPTGLPETAEPSLAARSRIAVKGAASSVRDAVTHPVQAAQDGLEAGIGAARNLRYNVAHPVHFARYGSCKARAVVAIAALVAGYVIINKLAKRIKARRAKKAAAKAVALDVEDLSLA